ncbi:winged helix-turn-helix domain-containing protein [Halolamina litorea]|uniref:Winged helix-turn-helix domain-containing protein n=1 Tax=Halolamina litorea TaxID=1515593 RepID=A0ABD6BUX3_9EURY|nr:winged helix-turn-helix domain-containing protein [Halolamina litorea]
MTEDTPPRIKPDGGSDGYDVNEAVEEEWVEETTPFDRVYEIIQRVYDPASAREIADRARVSPTTARKHLRTLARAGEVATSQDGQTTQYRRSETAIVTEHAQALLTERTPEEIASGIAEMKAQIREWREEYGVDSPEEFARELDVDDADRDHGPLLTEWQTTRRNLALAQATLAIAEASNSGHLTGADTDDDGHGDTSVIV